MDASLTFVLVYLRNSNASAFAITSVVFTLGSFSHFSSNAEGEFMTRVWKEKEDNFRISHEVHFGCFISLFMIDFWSYLIFYLFTLYGVA